MLDCISCDRIRIGDNFGSIDNVGGRMDLDNLILQQLDHMDLHSLSDLMGVIPDDESFRNFTDIKTFVLQVIHGESIWNTESLFQWIGELFLGQVQSSLSTCSLILLISMISGLLNGISDSMGKQTVSRVGTMICLSVTVSLTAVEFLRVYHYFQNQMELMIMTVQALFPVLIPMIAASGHVMTGTVTHPIILSFITAIATAVEHWILPAVFTSCYLCIIGRMVDQRFLNKTGTLIREGVIFVLGLIVTLFSAITAIQSTVGNTADSLLMKTARFSVDNFIPFIGGFAADSMDMVIQCTFAIKNAIGIWGILLLIVFMIVPLVRIAAIIVLFRIGSVFTEAVTEKTISGCMEDVSSALTTLAVVYILLGILFIAFLGILISIG